MLVKEGHKGSYLLWGVVQIVLSVVLIALTVPFMLSSVGIDTSVWLELTTKIRDWVGGKYIFGAIHASFIVLFIVAVLSIFFRKSGASLFVKLAGATAIFTFACKGLERFCLDVLGKEINIMPIFSGGLVYLLLAASVVLLILGFVFQFTVSRNNENKANVFLFTKSIVWIVLLTVNFVVPSILNISPWIAAIFGYTTLPYFLCWYFLIMGILQLVSSPQLINPQDSKFSTGTPPAPKMPMAFLPVQPVMVDPFTPVMPNNPALQGRKQGLESELEQETKETEEKNEIAQSLLSDNQNEAETKETEEITTEPETVEPVAGDTITQGLTEPENAEDSFISAPIQNEVEENTESEQETEPEDVKQEEPTQSSQEDTQIESQEATNNNSENDYSSSTQESGNVDNFEENTQGDFVAENDTVVQGLTPPEGFDEIQTLEQVREQNGIMETPTEPNNTQDETTEAPTEPIEATTEPAETMAEPVEEPVEPEETKEETPVEPEEVHDEPEETPAETTIAETPVEPIETPVEPMEAPVQNVEMPVVEQPVEEIVVPVAETVKETPKQKPKPMRKARTAKPKQEPVPVAEPEPEPEPIVEPEPIAKPEPKLESKPRVTKPRSATKPKAAAKTKPTVKTKPETKVVEEKAEKKEMSQAEKLSEIDKIIKIMSSPRQTSRTRKIRRDVEDDN